MTVNPNWSRRVLPLASGSSLELINWVRFTGAQLNSEQYVSKFSGANPNGVVLGAPGDLTVNVSLTSGTAGDLWTKQGTTANKSNWTRLVSSAAGGSGAPTNSAYVILGKDATLTSARSLKAGTNITLSDGGAGSTLTISSTGGSAVTFWEAMSITALGY